MEDIVTDTKDTAHEIFEAGPKGINIQKGNFEFYMPDGMAIQKNQDSLENNLIINEADQHYILFVNPLERKNSRVVYESSLADQVYLLNETFEKNDRFGFIQILELEDKLYEVTVGVGGAKLTTVTKKNNVSRSAEKMMQIANSAR